MASDVRVIAFYLPQYHPIPENDLWWGSGFTEWTKVVEAKPLFDGHHQPQLPGRLGFYDLRLPEAREAQTRLAGEYGVHGFCYYHYWFNGKRLLERPFREVLSSGHPKFPFCLCWANENWTRRWDGNDKEVLIAQNYSAEDDRAMIREIIPAFKDSRYIRIQGRPLFLVYRAGELPDPRATAQVWRDEAVAANLPGLYLCRMEAGLDAVLPQDPARIGFDAACEFPPHGVRLTKTNLSVERLDPAFTGFIYDYTDTVRDFATRPAPAYRRFRGVMPSWDNTPRAARRASLVTNSSPESYRAWLEMAVNHTLQEAQGDERLIFINAWNEWGEGCHLEPDRRFGLGWLEATRAALNYTRQRITSHAASEDQLRISSLICCLAGELGIDGAGPDAVLREALTLTRRWGAELAERDEAITGLNAKLARVTRLLAEHQSEPIDGDGLLVTTESGLAQ